MIEKFYAEDPAAFKRAWLNENNPKGITITFPEFKSKITPVGNENPKTSGWYEHNSKTHKYVLTEDTTVNEEKRYFIQNGELIYNENDIVDDSFNLKLSIQSGSNLDFVGCIASTLDFKVANDYKFLKDQKLYVTFSVSEGEILWKIRMFTGYVNETERDASKGLVRTIKAEDFMIRLLDDYDITDWYVWQYGDSNEETDIKHTIKELRDSFWDFICNDGIAYSPSGEALKKKGDGYTQVPNVELINDNLQVGKTLNVSPIDYDLYAGGELIGGPFEKGKTGTISAGWNVQDLVARKQVIDLGVIGTTFSYDGYPDTNYRQYLDSCDNAGTGIQATITVPKEQQDKVRETQITAATVLQAFCQFNGVFGQFNGEGQFEYIKLDISEPIEIDEQYQMTLNHSDFKMPKITGVSIFDKTSEEYSSDQIHTEYGDVKNGKKGSALAYYPSDRTKIEGDNANPYIIDNNFLLNSYKQSDAITAAQKLYEQVKDLTMVNCELEIKAMPWFKCGQAFSYYAPSEDTLFPSEDLLPSEDLYPSDFEKMTSILMSYDITGTGLIKAKITCKAEELKSEVVGLNEILSNEMFQRRIGDTRTYSNFLQTADKIQLEVVDQINNVKSSITQLANSIELRIDGPNGLVSRIALDEENILLQSQRITAEATRIDLIASEQTNIKTRLLNIESDEVIIKASKVSFEDLATGGRTVISGANIKTGTLNGDRLIAGTISCDKIKLGSVTLDGETYSMEWRKALLVDTKYGMQAHKLGVTVRPNNKTTTLYLNYSKNSDGAVTDIWINEQHTGTFNQAIANFVLGSNLISNGTDSESGNCAWGTTSTADSQYNAYWYGLGPGAGTGYRLILASENRAD